MDSGDEHHEDNAAASITSVETPLSVIVEVWAVEGPHNDMARGHIHINAPARDIDGRRFVALCVGDEWLCKFLFGKSAKTLAPVAKISGPSANKGRTEYVGKGL